MSGQLGLGVGVVAGTSLIVPGATINMKYWLSDSLSIMPLVQFKMSKTKDVDMSWVIKPGALVLYSPWKTTSTRLNVGGGLGVTFAKWGLAAIPGPLDPAPDPLAPPDLAHTPVTPPGSDMYIAVRLPIYVGVEHFFTKWFSMGIGLEDDFLTYGKQGDAWHLGVSIDNVNSVTAVGNLLFYTD